MGADLLSKNISSSAKIAETAIIGNNVSIGDNTVISDGVIIRDNVSIGANCRFHPYAVIGEAPQDRSFTGEESFIEIGDNNIFREFTTVHKAVGAGEKTIIGDNNMIMAYCHIAHNCQIGSNITMANNAQLAGHVVIEDNANIGGSAAIHQNCRVGRYAMVSGASASNKDLPPYFVFIDIPAIAIGINRVALKKAQISSESMNELIRAFKIIYKSKLSLPSAIEKIGADLKQTEEIKELLDFLKSSKRGIKTSR